MVEVEARADKKGGHSRPPDPNRAWEEDKPIRSEE